MWQYTGQKRPEFADSPGPGQESVWDYPRPPALVSSVCSLVVGEPAAPVAMCNTVLRVLETASPPTYYVPADAVDFSTLVAIDHRSYCEWKGTADYFAWCDGIPDQPVAWRYRDPSARFAQLHDHLSFYPGRIPCYLDGEPVAPQEGGFYGGWVTSRIVGPWKGAPGTGHW